MSAHRWLTMAWLCTLGLAGPAVTLHAQDLTPDRVQFALDLTDRRIAQAELVVQPAQNPQARTELTMATDLQSRAKSAFESRQLPLAYRLTLEARGHAERAIAMVRGLPDPDRVLTQLERTDDVLERVRDRIEECTTPRAHAMLQVAQSMEAKAREAADAGRYLGALQLTTGARDRAMRALRLCRLEDDAHDGAERALRRTDELLARAAEQLRARDPRDGRTLLARAQDLQTEAQRELGAERFEASLRLTFSARALVRRALRGSGAAR